MRKILYLLIGVIALGFTSCKSYIEDVNINPNVANDAPLEAILNSALVGTVLGQEGEDSRLGCMWAQQFTGSDRQYSSLNIYTITSGNYTWDKYYIAAQNAALAIEKGEATGNKLVTGIGKVVRALALGTVVAGWGDAPVTQANKLLEFPNPVYDKQADAYAEIQKILDGAIADLSTNPSYGPVTGKDFFYGGDPAKWTKLAYSLKARYYLHTKNYSAALAAAPNGITDPADAFVAPHGESQAENLNIYYDFIKVNREGYMTANGARLPSILDPASASYRGNAKTDESARFSFVYKGTAPDYDLNEAGMWAPAASFTIFSAQETHLIIAECSSRSNNDNDALTFLNSARAINAAVFGGTYDGYVLGDFDNTSGGMASNPGQSVSQALLMEIVEEKYCSLVGQNEVFNDLRRTKNMIGLVPTSGSQLPQRHLYPEVEINANSNVPSPLPTLYDPTPVNQ